MPYHSHHILFAIIFICWSCTRPPIDHSKDAKLSGQTPPSDMVFIAGKGNVPSFYVGVSEEPNINYVAYLNWLRRVYVDYPEVAEDARIKVKDVSKVTQFNDPQLVYHMEHPAFSYYPIVGASWNQIQEYLRWKTDRVNEEILIQLQILQADFNQMNEENFVLEAYLYDQYLGVQGKRAYEGKQPPNTAKGTWRDGILLSGFRLPTEAEWELLQFETYDNDFFGAYPYGKQYPTLRWVREPFDVDDYYYGDLKPTGDYDYFWKKGIIPKQEDTNSTIPGLKGPYISNNQRLPSNVKGNVREWLLDVYRQDKNKSWNSVQEYLGNNGFETRASEMKFIYDLDGIIDLKDSLGRFAFRILGINTDGSPMLVIPTSNYPIRVYNGTDTVLNYIDESLMPAISTVTTFESFFTTYEHQVHREFLVFWFGVDPTFRTNQKQFDFFNRVSQMGYRSHYTPSNIPKFNPDSLRKLVKTWSRGYWDAEIEKGLVGIGMLGGELFYRDENGLYYKSLVSKINRIYNQYSDSPRLIRGGTWMDPNFESRSFMKPDSASVEVGFRCVLPFTSIPVKKEDRVRWR